MSSPLLAPPRSLLAPAPYLAPHTPRILAPHALGASRPRLLPLPALPWSTLTLALA